MVKIPTLSFTVALVTAFAQFSAEATATEQYIDFETDANGTPFSGSSLVVPADEYEPFGVVFYPSWHLPHLVQLQLTNPANVGTDISGYYLNVVAYQYGTYLEIVFDPPVSEISFDFAARDPSLRTLAFDRFGEVVLETSFVGEHEFLSQSGLPMLGGHALISLEVPVSRLRTEPSGTSGYVVDNLRFVQETSAYVMKRVTVSTVGGRVASASYASSVTASFLQGPTGVCPSGTTTTLGFWSVLGAQDVPLVLTVSKNEADPLNVDLSWSGQAAEFNIYRSTSPVDLNSPVNLLSTTSACAETDTDAHASGNLYYLVSAGSP